MAKHEGPLAVLKEIAAARALLRAKAKREALSEPGAVHSQANGDDGLPEPGYLIDSSCTISCV